MRRYWLQLLFVGALALASVGHTGRSTGQIPFGPHDTPRRFPEFDSVVKGAKEHDGLFKLYHKDDQVFAEIKPDQLNRPYLCPIAIARGRAQGGHTLNNSDQWVLLFKRVGDRVFLVRRNVHYHAKPGSPVARAVETTYADSVLMSLRIHAVHPS